MDDPEYLDHWIEQHISGGRQLSPIDETIAPMLATAQLLVQLQTIALPPTFASRLETSLRACIHHLSQQ